MRFDSKTRQLNDVRKQRARFVVNNSSNQHAFYSQQNRCLDGENMSENDHVHDPQQKTFAADFTPLVVFLQKQGFNHALAVQKALCAEGEAANIKTYIVCALGSVSTHPRLLFIEH